MLFGGLASPAGSDSSSVNSNCSSQRSANSLASSAGGVVGVGGNMGAVAASQQANPTLQTTGQVGAGGYRVKLLFFDLCYASTAVDAFLRSSLSGP